MIFLTATSVLHPAVIFHALWTWHAFVGTRRDFRLHAADNIWTPLAALRVSRWYESNRAAELTLSAYSFAFF